MQWLVPWFVTECQGFPMSLCCAVPECVQQAQAGRGATSRGDPELGRAGQPLHWEGPGHPRKTEGAPAATPGAERHAHLPWSCGARGCWSGGHDLCSMSSALHHPFLLYHWDVHNHDVLHRWEETVSHGRRTRRHDRWCIATRVHIAFMHWPC